VKNATKVTLYCPIFGLFYLGFLDISHLALRIQAMFKFVIIYRRVDDEERLEHFFSQTNLPLAEKLPGLVKSEVSRVRGKPGGDSRFHLMYELYFETPDAFYEALASPSGQLLSRELKAWSDARLITWFYAESWEEAAVGQGG
jgi:uncharacterized protein (TIGR02118 family)